MHLNEGPLKSQEAAYRNRLLVDPTDFNARMDLAWCLFLQGIVVAASEELPTSGQSPAITFAPDRQAAVRILLSTSLRESMKVCRMSANPAHHAEAARLQFLVAAIGEEQAIAPAETAVEGLVRHLAGDLSAEPVASPRLHRSITLSRGNAESPAGERTRKGARRQSPRAPHRPSEPGA